MSVIELCKCPNCGREDFNSTEDFVNHIRAHNTKDVEYDKSVVAEEEQSKDHLFG